MSVHYKFKSALSFDTITFDGLHISVRDLKKAILQQKQIGKATDFDLQITNAQSNEVYDDENVLIPKNSSLIVVRVPLTAQQKKNWEKPDSLPVLNNKQFIAEGLDPVVTRLAKTVDLANVDASEEDKIQAAITQSTLDYDPSNYLRIKGSNQVGELPANYRCYKCMQPGHWIKDCKFNNQQDAVEIKKSTGIPRSFMVPVEGPGVPGAMMTPMGHFAVPSIEHEARKEPMRKAIESPAMEKLTIPEDLLCGVCKDLLNEAVLIPCCGNSFCDECIRNVLLESEDHQCPDCKEKDVCPNTLIPNRFLRNSVNNFKNQTGYMRAVPVKATAPPPQLPPPVVTVAPSLVTIPVMDELIQPPRVSPPATPASPDNKEEPTVTPDGEDQPPRHHKEKPGGYMHKRSRHEARKHERNERWRVERSGTPTVDEQSNERFPINVHVSEPNMNHPPMHHMNQQPPPMNNANQHNLRGPPPIYPRGGGGNYMFPRQPFNRGSRGPNMPFSHPPGGPHMRGVPGFRGRPRAPFRPHSPNNTTIQPETIDDPVEAFNRFLQQQDLKRIHHSRSRSPFSRSPRSRSPPPPRRIRSRSRSRSRTRASSRARSASRSPPLRRRRTKSRSPFSLSRSTSRSARSISRSPSRDRRFSPPRRREYRSPIRPSSPIRYYSSKAKEDQPYSGPPPSRNGRGGRYGSKSQDYYSQDYSRESDRFDRPPGRDRERFDRDSRDKVDRFDRDRLDRGERIDRDRDRIVDRDKDRLDREKDRDRLERDRSERIEKDRVFERDRIENRERIVEKDRDRERDKDRERERSYPSYKRYDTYEAMREYDHPLRDAARDWEKTRDREIEMREKEKLQGEYFRKRERINPLEAFEITREPLAPPGEEERDRVLIDVPVSSEPLEPSRSPEKEKKPKEKKKKKKEDSERKKKKKKLKEKAEKKEALEEGEIASDKPDQPEDEAQVEDVQKDELYGDLGANIDQFVVQNYNKPIVEVKTEANIDENVMLAPVPELSKWEKDEEVLHQVEENKRAKADEDKQVTSEVLERALNVITKKVVKPIEKKVEKKSEIREIREAREAREVVRDIRDPREVRDTRDLRDPRDPRDIRDLRDTREIRDLRDPRDIRDSRDIRDMRDPRDTRERRSRERERDRRDDRREESDRYNKDVPKSVALPVKSEYDRRRSSSRSRLPAKPTPGRISAKERLGAKVEDKVVVKKDVRADKREIKIVDKVPKSIVRREKEITPERHKTSKRSDSRHSERKSSENTAIREVKKPSLDESAFVPDYEKPELDESKLFNVTESKKRSVSVEKGPESKKIKVDVASKASTEDSSPSSEESSKSIRKKKKKKHKKKKKKRKHDSSSDSDSSDSSSPSESEKKKKKHKHKSHKKSKKRKKSKK